MPSLVFPQAIRIILQLFFRISDRQHQDSHQHDSGSDSTGTRIVLHTLLRLVASSRRNQIALASTALSTILLDPILPADNTDSTHSIPSSISMSALTQAAEETNRSAANTQSQATPLKARTQHADLLASILRHLYATAGFRTMTVASSSSTSHRLLKVRRQPQLLRPMTAIEYSIYSWTLLRPRRNPTPSCSAWPSMVTLRSRSPTLRRPFPPAAASRASLSSPPSLSSV